MAPPTSLLLIATEPLTAEVVSWAIDRAGEGQVTLLPLSDDLGPVEMPQAWSMLAPVALGKAEQLRDDILSFLESVPTSQVDGDRTFDELFRLSGGYSLWWNEPAAYRHQDKAVFAALRAVWMLTRALEQRSIDEVLIFSARPNVVAILASKCQREGIGYALAPGSSQSARAPWAGKLRWFLLGLIWIAAFPCLVLLRCLMARASTCRGRPPKATRDQPAIVFTGDFPRHIRHDTNGPSIWYWQELSEAFSRARPDIRQHYMLHTEPGRCGGYRMVMGVYHTGWPVLRRLPNVGPIPQRQWPIGTFLRAVPRQLTAMLRYARIEARPSFRSSLTFCGTDVSFLYIPLIRRSVSRMASWATSVAAVVKSIKVIGNVCLIVVNEEMYGWGRTDIAAARQLGVPTLGVQHGAIFPMHLIYTPPQGQIDGTPTPDYFAAYGEFAKDVLTKIGAYPAERVWIAGTPRFDPMINTPPDKLAARRRLGVDNRKKVVVLTTHRLEWFLAVAKITLQVCASRSNTVVYIKRHPVVDHPVKTYELLAKQAGAVNVQICDDRFDDLLAACDVLIGGYSTTVMEAILLGRQTICVNFSDEEDRYPFATEGPSLPARDERELHVALEQALSNSDESVQGPLRESFLRRHLGPTVDGKAAETLAGKIADVIDRG